jgi:hypothetical protein
MTYILENLKMTKVIYILRQTEYKLWLDHIPIFLEDAFLY